MGVISTHAALCFTPPVRKTRHTGNTVSMLCSSRIAVPLGVIRLSRLSFAGALPLSSDVGIPAHQAIRAIWETVKLGVLAQCEGHRTKTVIVFPALRLEVKATLFK